MSKRLSLGFLIVAATVPMLGIPTAAMALDSSSADYLAKAGECLMLFLSDPAKHDEACLPTKVTADQLNSMGGFNSFTTCVTISASSSSYLSCGPR